MRRLIVSNHMTLDGFFEGPNREIDWFAGRRDGIEYSKEMLRCAGALVFGRVTYELMFSYWPAAPKDEVAEKMNTLPKIVFSSTLARAEWNNCRLVKTSASEELAKLKQQPGKEKDDDNDNDNDKQKDLVILGSAALASSLLPLGLIDEYRVILNPILLGRGNPLFKGLKEKVSFKLHETKTFGSDAVVLYYRKA